LPAGEIPTLKPVDKNFSRPRLPPPGPPGGTDASGLKNSSLLHFQSLTYFFFLTLDKSLSNGQSNESICSLDEGPIAPPRKVSSFV
jgi:Arf-GAP with SH3 domain, ANK repeat and PH domain-containing protein